MVRTGGLYRFVAVLMDRNIVPDGTIVRVVFVSKVGLSTRSRLPRCFRYVEHVDGRFIQMVCTNSLTPLTKMEREFVQKVIRQRKVYTSPCSGFDIRSTREPNTEQIEVI